MVWLWVAILLLLFWVISLCKVLYSPSNAAFLSTGDTNKKRNVMLIIAHPDDESMFFSPTIQYLTSRGHNIHILCLSTGNSDGQGKIRKDELYRAAATLKVPLKQIKIIDHPDLQDGFNNMWSSGLLSKIVREETTSQGIDLLITFDKYGVSGHPNHRDVHYGVCMFLCEKPQFEAYALVSANILRKYSGPVDILLSILLTSYNSNGDMHWLTNEDPRKTRIAMEQHESQWLWFRKLFVLFSSYTYVNVLRKIKA